jgi:glycosyltransferase involved in cell wall biosynthesis
VALRILYSHRIQSRDGQGVHVDELVAAFRAEGHEVLMVGPAAYEKTGFGGESSSLARWRRLLPGALGELAELGYAGPAALRLVRAYRRFRPDLVYERYNLFHLAGAVLARRHGAKLFLEVNAPLAEERTKFGGLKLARLARAVEGATWRSAARVLPVTGVLGRMVQAAGVPPDRISVIPNAIVPERFAAPARPERPDPMVLGFVGFVRAWHGLDRVVAAMAAERDLRMVLRVVGDGPVRGALEAQAVSLGLADRVAFTGVVPNDRVPALVAGFDIALQPSVTPYASPLKIFDYMAAGCAIVAPDQENIREVLVHERTALLFDPAVPDAAWQAVRLLAADGGLRRRLGAAARVQALAHHTWRGNARRIVALAQG